MKDFLIEVTRKWKKPTYTISKWNVDGKWFCDGIEDRDRGLSNHMSEKTILECKIFGETAIPTGKYEIKMSYSPKFGKKEKYEWCKGVLPEIVGVKGFSGIRIHAGNTAKDSLGCLIPGRNNKVGWVSNSMNECKKIFPMIQQAIKDGRKCYILIR